jgi:hypothetical protein
MKLCGQVRNVTASQRAVNVQRTPFNKRVAEFGEVDSSTLGRHWRSILNPDSASQLPNCSLPGKEIQVNRANPSQFCLGNSLWEQTKYTHSVNGSHINLAVGNHGCDEFIVCSEIVASVRSLIAVVEFVR